jgi:hypothetical protein
VRDRHGELDVAHAFATDASEGYFDAATVADDALVLDALVLSAGALPIPGGTENALAEEAALLWFEGAVIDRLWIFYLAVTPRADGIGRGDGNRDLVEADGAFLAENFANVRFDYVHVGSFELRLTWNLLD